MFDLINRTIEAAKDLAGPHDPTTIAPRTQFPFTAYPNTALATTAPPILAPPTIAPPIIAPPIMAPPTIARPTVARSSTAWPDINSGGPKPLVSAGAEAITRQPAVPSSNEALGKSSFQGLAVQAPPAKERSALLRAIVDHDHKTSKSDRYRAIELRWVLRDIGANRLKFSPVQPHDLQILIDLELVELREGVPQLTDVGVTAAT